MKTLYLKDSGNRKKQYSLTTRICVENGKKFVIKEPCFPDGIPHIESIIENQRRLAEYYPNIEINKTWIENGALYAEYVDGIKFSQFYIKAIQDNDKDELKKLFTYHIELFLGQNNTCIFKETDEFVEIFGKAPFFEGKPALIFTFFDPLPENIILRDGNIKKPCFIDYEWSFNFPIPVSLLKFRTVLMLSMLPGMNEIFSIDDLMNFFACGIPFDQGMVFFNKFVDFVCFEMDSYKRKSKPLYSMIKFLLSLEKYGIKKTLRKVIKVMWRQLSG